MKKINVLNLVLPILIVMMAFSSCDRGALYDDFDDSFADQNGSDYDGDDEQGSFGDGETFLTLYRISGDNIDKIKDYSVSGSYKKLQEDYAKHLEMWNYFTDLIPVENRINITEFLVFEGGGSLAGFVEPIEEDDLGAWRMGLAIDVADNLENIDLKEEFAAVSIHEFGHVLTLNSTQVEVGGSENSCGTFHTGEGCSKSNSYINELFNIGWADIYDEFLDTKENKIYTRFYPKYQDRFVSEYAATNPGEDVAEVFTYFVTENNRRPNTTIAAKKINALYAYPELVQLRKEIRRNPTVRTMNVNQVRRAPCRHNKAHRLDFALNN